MSQHASLRSDKKGGHYRNVLKRWEKIKHLLKKEKWVKEEDSVFNLPKVKRIKLKIKKKRSAVDKDKENDQEETSSAAEKTAASKDAVKKPKAE